jgi:hypothetical protein
LSPSSNRELEIGGPIFDVAERTMRGWESGIRDGKPAPISRPIAVLVRLALKNAPARRELGIASKA